MGFLLEMWGSAKPSHRPAVCYLIQPPRGVAGSSKRFAEASAEPRPTRAPNEPPRAGPALSEAVPYSANGLSPAPAGRGVQTTFGSSNQPAGGSGHSGSAAGSA